MANKTKYFHMLLHHNYVHLRKPRSKESGTRSSFEVCDAAVTDSCLSAMLFECQTQYNL